MKTYSEDETRSDLHHVLEQARVLGAVRVRRADGHEFVIRPVEGGDLFDRVADEQDTWFDAIAPVVAIRDDLRCTECGYNLRSLSAGHRCPECGQPIRDTIDVLSASNPQVRSNLRRAQAEYIAESSDYPADGFLFIIDAIVDGCRRGLSSLPQEPVPLDAPSVCTMIRDYGRRYFNDESEALELLDEWKLRSSEDLGAIVRVLLDAGALAVTGGDKLSDYRGIFTLATLFDS